MTFRDAIIENKSTTQITIYGNTSDTQLCRALNKSESDMIINGLYQNPKFVSKNGTFLKQIADENVKYSDDITITYLGKTFTLYSANGKLRMGGAGVFGGNSNWDFYNCDELKKIKITTLSKTLPGADVK